MARSRAGRKRKAVLLVERPVDATPERLAKGDCFTFVNPAEIDSSEQPIGLTRRFKSAHLDRLYRRDDPARSRLTYRQWAAGDWYRTQHARCSFALSVVASYGERTSASEPSYGLPRTEAQAQSRHLFMKARQQIPVAMLGYVDRLVIYDDLPRYGGRAAHRSIAQLASALDGLANWLKIN